MARRKDLNQVKNKNEPFFVTLLLSIPRLLIVIGDGVRLVLGFIFYTMVAIFTVVRFVIKESGYALIHWTREKQALLQKIGKQKAGRPKKSRPLPKIQFPKFIWPKITIPTFHLPHLSFPKLSLPIKKTHPPVAPPIATKVSTNLDQLKSFIAGVSITILFFILPYNAYHWLKALPNPQLLSRRDLEVTTKIFDRNGALLYEIYADQN